MGKVKFIMGKVFMLDIYDNVVKILNFKSSSVECFQELDKLRTFLKNEKIFEKNFEMKSISEISIVNYTEKEEISVEILNDSQEEYNSLKQPQYDIFYDIEFENLRDNLLETKKKQITLKKLKATNDDVNILF